MKTLYLMRHAEAGQKESRADDRNRELTQAGIKHSLHMGAFFRERNLSCDLVICSSALRAEQTAHIMSEGLKREHLRILSEDVLYEASVRQLLEYVNNIEDGYHHVVLIAHNPAISYLAEYLTKADIGDMAPGAMVAIKFDFSSWKLVSEGTGTVEAQIGKSGLPGQEAG